MKPSSPSRVPRFALFVLWICWLGAGSVRANVFASDIRLNGSPRVGVILPGTSVTISYVLNDNADAGVWIKILSRTNVIKTFSSTNGAAGASAGLNTVIWDGSFDHGTNSYLGTFTVSITAASEGYDDWTNITDDGTNFTVLVPRGIAVNQNTNSPYYGRVFVANAIDPYGIFKFNADGSPADEGNFSPWVGGDLVHYSPWKMAISRDDRVYVDDLSGSGVVFACDQLISTNCYTAIGTDNYPTNDASPYLSGLAVTGSGTNTQIWMADGQTNGDSEGIIVWSAAGNGLAATNDTGTIVAPVDATNSLSFAPWDVALNTNDSIFVIQSVTNDGADAPLMDFPPFRGSPETNTNWAIGYGDPDLMAASGLAVNPAATYVAVAVRGPGDEEYQGGALNLYTANDGTFLTNLDQTGGDRYYDVAWDAVGNLYALDDNAQVWRVYSPPGSNQSTTIAAPFIQAYNKITAPVLHNPVLGMNGLRLTLYGQSNITYVVQYSPDLVNWTPVATNYSPNAVRNVCVPYSSIYNITGNGPGPSGQAYLTVVSVP